MPLPTARWVDEFRRRILRGKHVLLYGNVQDLVLFRDSYYGFDECLDVLLEDLGYLVRVRYDFVDGVTFPSPEMRDEFLELVRPDGAGTAAPSGTPYRPPGRAQPGGLAAGHTGEERGSPDLIALDVALPALRRALSNPSRPLAVLLDFSDKLASSQSHHDLLDRTTLMQVRKMASGATRHTTGALAGQRNPLILVAPVLGQVPDWLYRDNPLFQTIQVDRPQADERKHFLRQFHGSFYGPHAAAPDERLVEDFSDLTDGLSNWDLESLRLTSHHERLGLDRLRQLVDFYKYGEKEDHWEKLSEQKIREAEHLLKRRVIGQDQAIEAVLNMLITAKVGIQAAPSVGKSGRPKGVFFFVGPTGVGKTELAKALTELIFGDESMFARFDMSEYAQEHAAEKLTGAPPSYVGYEEGGQLTNHMKAKPFSLLIFDEIEKAHPKLMDRFLQVLDDGRLTDGRGETVYFSQSVIVFTSNLGSTRRIREGTYERVVAAVTKDMDYPALVQHYRRSVEDHLRFEMGRPELLNRLGENIVVFDILRPESIPRILDKFLEGLRQSAQEKRGVEVIFDPTVTDYVSAWCQHEERILFGGRGVRNIVENQIVQALNRFAFYQVSPRGSRLRVRWEAEVGIIVEPVT